jgi:hypothetical protein
MAKRCLVILITFFLFCSLNQSWASTDPTVCEDPSQWLSVFLPPEVIAIVCSISDTSEPFTVELDGTNGVNPSSGNEVELIQETNLPEQTKQELILWLLFWTQQ